MAHTFRLAFAATLTLASTALAQDAKPAPAKPEAQDEQKETKTLTIGDKAPAIDVSNWIKGDKVEKFQDGKVYVVEFWATWCPPCRGSMPHMSELQKQYRDYGVTFIGISDEPLKTVTDFLAKKSEKDPEKTWNDVIGYTLTTDPDKSVMNDYFKAAGQAGIPCAFIVGKDQHVEWIGNPHPQSDDHFDTALEAVVKDTFDRKAFKAEWEKKATSEREAMENQKTLATAMRAKDWNKVLEIAGNMLSKNPKDINAGMIKFRTLAINMNEPDKGYEFLRNFIEPFWDNAQVLNQFAWLIVDDQDLKTRDVDLALGYAMRANKLSDNKDPAILDTLAHCFHEKGNLAEAIKIEEQAASKAGDDQMAKDIKDTLKKYQDEAAKKKGG